MNDSVHPALLRYSRREISALRAADLMGKDVSVSEVIEMVRAAGLPFPIQDPREAEIELARARRVLGLPHPKSVS